MNNDVELPQENHDIMTNQGRASYSFDDNDIAMRKTIQKLEYAFRSMVCPNPIYRWLNAREKANKFSRGLLRDKKVRRLATRHWIEAIDPRHRYGHNLQSYFLVWKGCDTRQRFLFWLDRGDGRDITIKECPRETLQDQQIKYLPIEERSKYEVIIKNGKLMYKQSRTLLHTTSESKGHKWIFVLSTSQKFYVGQKQKGSFQHSSFLAGGPTLAAGSLIVKDGVLQCISRQSGHYLPTDDNVSALCSFLHENHVDLNNVQIDSICEERQPAEQTNNNGIDHGFLKSARDHEGAEDRDQFQAVSSDQFRAVSRKRVLKRAHSEIISRSYPVGEGLYLHWYIGPGPSQTDYPPDVQMKGLRACRSIS